MSETSRFRSLEGILAKPPAKRVPLRPVGGDENSSDEPPAPQRRSVAESASSRGKSVNPAETSPGRKTTTPAPRNAAPASRSAGGTRRVAFRLEEGLARALSDRVVQDGTSQAHVVLDAIEAAHIAGTLADLVRAQQRPATTGGALFARPAVRGAASASVATEIRLDAGSLLVLDDLVETTEADTRTQLIVAALMAHLC